MPTPIIAVRLTEALADAHQSVRWLWKALARTSPRPAGAHKLSYSTVRGYMQGETAPPVALLETAARLLGVSPAWLAFGVGPRPAAAGIVGSARDAALARAAEAALADGARHAEAVRTAFARAFPPAADDGGAAWAAAAGPWYHARARFDAVPRAGQEPGELKAAQAVGRALAAPLRALGLEPEGVSPWQLRHYVGLVSAALEGVLIGKAELEYRRATFTVVKSRGRARQLHRARLAAARTPEGKKAVDDKLRATLGRAAALKRKQDLEKVRIGTTVGH